MANLSNVTYSGNGSQTQFVYNLGYIAQDDVSVYLGGVLQTVTTHYTWEPDGTTITFVTAPISGTDNVYISRDSDVSAKTATYADGSSLTEESLNDNGDQSIYLHQETRDLITTINAANASYDGRITTNEADILEVETNQDDIVTLTGVAENATDLGTFTGDIITDTSTIKVALQELETEILNPDIAVASFTPAAAPSHSEGQVFYDNSTDTLSYHNDETEVQVDIGQKMMIKGRNNTGVTIVKGAAVYISGATGNKPTIALADADSFATSEVVGIAAHDIENSSNGYITIIGLVNGLDTSAYTEGDTLYLSSTAGDITGTKPTYPAQVVHIGTVTYSHASTGEILIITHNEVNVIIDALVAADLTKVTTVGTPVDNQIGVWTGDGTLEGEANFTYDSTLDHLELTGEFDIIHVATGSNEHALEIDVTSGGNGDVKALDIFYDTGAIGSANDEAVISVNVDRSNSTGGDISALEVLATEGSAEVNGMFVGALVNPVEQLSGVFSDMDSALVNATDRLAEFISDASDIVMFVADNDTVTIGNAAKFEELEFLLSTVASKNIKPTFEYSTGVGTWATFTPVDGTNGMTNNGIIAWLDSDISSWAVGLASEYLIRITRTVNGSITSPIESKVQIVDAVEYKWTKDGKLDVAGIDLGSSTPVTSILDEDAMGSDSATALATQQSIKAYADTKQPDLITTRGDTIIGGTGGAAERLPIGTAGQVLKSDGTDVIWGVGGGAGGINYITDGSVDAEADIGDWLLYADAAGVNPVDGFETTPSATVTFARTASTILRGTYNFKFTNSAANNQGDGAAVAFTIDEADKAKKLTISFDYDATDANYADDDIRIAVYDVTNSQLIRINGEDLKGGDGTHYAQFQTASNSTSYRLIIHQSSTTFTGYSVYFDNFKVGPTSIAKGSIISDWRDYTPTGSWVSNTTFTGKYRRVGDSMEIYMTVELTGTPTSATFAATIPSGYTIDEDKLSASFASNKTNLGHVYAYDSSTSTNRNSGYATAHSSTEIRILTDGFGVLGVSSPFTWASGDHIEMSIKVPIVGWSSDTAMSSDLGGRDVSVVAYGAPVTSVAGSVAIPFNYSELKDTTSSWDGTQFTAPESGDYLLVYSLHHVSKTDYHGVWVDGSTIGWTAYEPASDVFNGTKVVTLNKGQTMSVRMNGATTPVLNSINHRISIQKLASPQTILETETVAAMYGTDAGLSIPNAAVTTIIHEDISYDTHNAYNTSTGEYTIPVSGKYILSTNIGWNGVSVASGDLYRLLVYKSGVIAVDVYLETNATNSSSRPNVGQSATIDFVKGDIVLIKVYQNSGVAASLMTDAQVNYFSIARIK